MGGYAIRGGQAGYDRLQLLAAERHDDTAALLDRAGVVAGMVCVDLGCGGAAVTFELAQRVGPTGSVTGVDLDEVKVELDRAAASDRGLDNVTFVVANLTSWAAPATFDVVYARFVLQHIPNPVDMLARMWAAVRVGGRIIIEDADFGGCFSEPANPGFELFLRTYPEVLRRRGADATIGRKLHSYFRQAGIPTPALSVVNSAHTSGWFKTLRLSTLEATAEAIQAEGLASAAQLNEAARSLAEFTADPRTVIGGPQVFQAWSVRQD